MTLATRCTACGTIFRVVQDQLRVSQGWVRCGRCGEAFNAVESLVDLPPPRVPSPFATGPADGHPPISDPFGAAVAAPTAPVEPVPAWPAATGASPAATPADATVADDAVAMVEADAMPAADAAPAGPVDAQADLADAQPPAPATPPAPVRTPTADEVLALALERAAAAELAPPMATAPLSARGDNASASIRYVATDGAVLDAADVPRPPMPAEPAAWGSPMDASAPVVVPDAADGHVASDMDAASAPADTGPSTTSATDDLQPASETRVEPVLEPMPEPFDETSQPPDPVGPAQEAPPMVAPSFIVKADRAARWRRPGVRAALSVGVLLAAVGLAGQFTYVFRDRLAAVYPAGRPLLQQACGWLDCRIGDVRQIDALSVESSGLVRVEGSPVYRLSITLRNRAPIEVAAPALDLSLTDAQGKPIARRVLTMADLDLPLRTLKAGSELPMQVPLGIGDRQVSGYTVEIFYP